MSISTVNAATIANPQQQAPANLGNNTPAASTSAGSPRTNPYGTITQTYQSDSVFTTTSNASYNLASVTASSAGNTGIGSRLLAVAQALKDATPVDLSTGLQEISDGAKASLTQALELYLAPLLGVNTTGLIASGGVTESDLDAAAASAVQQFTSGPTAGSLSLSLSEVQNMQWSDGGGPTLGSGIASALNTTGITTLREMRSMTLTFGSDGTISGSFDDTGYVSDQGTRTEQGVLGANAT